MDVDDEVWPPPPERVVTQTKAVKPQDIQREPKLDVIVVMWVITAGDIALRLYGSYGLSALSSIGGFISFSPALLLPGVRDKLGVNHGNPLSGTQLRNVGELIGVPVILFALRYLSKAS